MKISPAIYQLRDIGNLYELLSALPAWGFYPLPLFFAEPYLNSQIVPQINEDYDPNITSPDNVPLEENIRLSLKIDTIVITGSLGIFLIVTSNVFAAIPILRLKPREILTND